MKGESEGSVSSVPRVKHKCGNISGALPCYFPPPLNAVIIYFLSFIGLGQLLVQLNCLLMSSYYGRQCESYGCGSYGCFCCSPGAAFQWDPCLSFSHFSLCAWVHNSAIGAEWNIFCVLLFSTHNLTYNLKEKISVTVTLIIFKIIPHLHKKKMKHCNEMCCNIKLRKNFDSVCPWGREVTHSFIRIATVQRPSITEPLAEIGAKASPFA